MTDDMRPAVAKALLTIGAHMEHDTDETDLLAEVLNDAYNAGATDARQWRPLTSDPKTWPEEGQVVVLCEDFYPIDEELNRCGPREPRYCVGPFTSGCKEFWSWWLPLPDPPQEKSE